MGEGCATETARAGARAVDGWATKKAVWTQFWHGLEQGGLGRTDGNVVVVGRCSEDWRFLSHALQ
jgi:hypothetical protein